jgi:hypothetical protein
MSARIRAHCPLPTCQSQGALGVNELISTCVDKINNVFSIADDLEGYVHLLSKVTASKNSKVTFFYCHIQTDENTKVCAVCYSPEKSINIQQAYKNKSQVKISGVKASVTKRFHAGLDEYTITKKAKIMPSSPTFEYNEALSSTVFTRLSTAALFKFSELQMRCSLKKLLFVNYRRTFNNKINKF